MTQALFNQHAKDYDDYAQIQRQIASALIDQIPASFEPQNILEIGAGTAYISEKLSRTYPNTHITICDPAPRMIEVARQKFDKQNNISFDCIDIPKNGQYDLIISSMAIQWVDDWADWMSKVSNLISQNGRLFIATPTQGTLKFLPLAFQSAELNYSGLKYRSASDLKRSASYLNKCSIFTQAFYENFDSPLNFFRKLHKIGANVSHTPLSPVQFKRLLKECEKHKRDGILEAKYEVTFLQASHT